MEIVRLSKKDVDDVLRIDNLAFSDYDIPPIAKKELLGFLDDGFILGIRENGMLVSNIQVAPKDTGWFIEGIATLPEKQGHGFADMLISEAVKLARKKKIGKISATIKPGNAKSAELFKKHGFREEGFLKDYYGKGKHRILVSAILE